MKLVKKMLLGLLIVTQFFQPGRNKSDRILSTDLVKTIDVPGNIQGILKTACFDCHSNNTNYPWYSRIQPFAWLLSNHVNEGKAELNFSDFGSYSPRRQISKLNEIANSIKEGAMPLSSYKMLHEEARMSSQNKKLLIEWATKLKDSLSLNK